VELLTLQLSEANR
jgi:DNA helicase IV